MELSAEFFDLFGVLAFAFILIAGILIKYKRRKMSKKAFSFIGVCLILIGIIGLIVDVVMVTLKFFR